MGECYLEGAGGVKDVFKLGRCRTRVPGQISRNKTTT